MKEPHLGALPKAAAVFADVAYAKGLRHRRACGTRLGRAFVELTSDRRVVLGDIVHFEDKYGR